MQETKRILVNNLNDTSNFIPYLIPNNLFFSKIFDIPARANKQKLKHYNISKCYCK